MREGRGERWIDRLNVLIRNHLVSCKMCFTLNFIELLVSSPSPQQIFLKVAEDSGVDAAELSG